MSFTKITRATEYINAGFGKFNNLVDDLLSTANGKGASQVGIEDTAGNMSADNVEDALAEIYTDHSSTKTLAEILDEDPSTTSSLTWGYKGGNFRSDNTITSISDGTIGLTDNDTNYIEIDPSDATVKKNTTGFTTGRVPIRQVVTSSGSQDTSTDKRAWFSNAVDASETQKGIVELATDAETATGTDTGRVITPSTLSTYVATQIPSGVIVMWSGTIANIPSGWYICDGNNGTPNLTDRFVIHADADAAGTNNVGDTGGSNTIAEGQLPSHSHGDGTLATDNDSHSHGDGSLATNTTGAHTHTITTVDNNPPPNDAGVGDFTGTQSTDNTSSDGDHSHTISGSTGSDTHSHDVTGSTGSTGSGSVFKPKYYALAYIQKG